MVNQSCDSNAIDISDKDDIMNVFTKLKRRYNMNKKDLDILLSLSINDYENQRKVSVDSGYSLGTVNKSIKKLIERNYIDEKYKPTCKGIELIHARKPQKAVILAAGLGRRIVPINAETPKALLEVQGQTLIERLICQLREVGVNEIYVVVGFMKERFEYLIDTYNVSLIVNNEYASRNNLHSLTLAKQHLENAYIVPCDIWCKDNPFRFNEISSWYAVKQTKNDNSQVRVNRKEELTIINGEEKGNAMVGISYLCAEDAKRLCEKIETMDSDPRFYNCFWEDALYEKGKMIVPARILSEGTVAEINTYEQLRELDSGSNHLKSDALSIISESLSVPKEEIKKISALKKGMTNCSFMFECRGRKYIMRIPGEGTNKIINRFEETQVYKALDGKNICDEVIYINPINGYKITEMIENARVCNPSNKSDVAKCMKKMRSFHNQNLKVEHKFDIFAQIEYYETLWGGMQSEYKDYYDTKKNVLSLKPYIDKNVDNICLTHIDAVPDNFLIYTEENQEKIIMIDWEYAGMQDPHVDIAMFCIYAGYDRDEVENVIDLYFPEGCPESTRVKIYCYISACGLLWSNWCEYKRIFGVEFGEYSLKQYRYAKEYYKIVKESGRL